MAAIDLYRSTDNDITINLSGISNVTSMTVLLIRKDTNAVTTITSASGKITLNPTTAVLRIDKELIATRGIYIIQISVISSSLTRGLKPTPDFLTVI